MFSDVERNTIETRDVRLGSFASIRPARAMSPAILVLLFIAMPLKYFMDSPQAVTIVGWIHGVLFVAYMISGLEVRKTYKWPFKKVLTAVAASLIPFGPFILWEESAIKSTPRSSQLMGILPSAWMASV